MLPLDSSARPLKHPFFLVSSQNVRWVLQFVCHFILLNSGLFIRQCLTIAGGVTCFMSTLSKPNHCSNSAVRWRTDGEMGDVIDVGAVVKHLNQFGGACHIGCWCTVRLQWQWSSW